MVEMSFRTQVLPQSPVGIGLGSAMVKGRLVLLYIIASTVNSIAALVQYSAGLPRRCADMGGNRDYIF